MAMETGPVGAEVSRAVFDVHLHALRPGWASPAEPLGESAPVLRATVEQMDRHGVQRGFVSGDYVAVQAWVRAHPTRFLAAFNYADYERSAATERAFGGYRAPPAQFEREVQAGRWHALGELLLPYDGRPLNHPALFPYYAVCQRHGLPALFHCGLDGPWPQRVFPRFRVELGDPLLLQEVITRFPDLKVVICHMGWPFFDHALYLLYAYPQVYVDTGVVNWILAPSVFQRILREAVETAPAQVLFGSDQMTWPEQITPALEAVTGAAALTAEQKRRVLWDNAQALLARPVASPVAAPVAAPVAPTASAPV
jgi:predicted TIM-barrel fold metal-dependent hydrolase